MELSSFLLPLISECRKRFGEWSLSLDMEQCSVVSASTSLTAPTSNLLPDSLQTIEVENCGKRLSAKAKEVRCKVSEPCCLVSAHLSNLIFCDHGIKLSSKHLESGLAFCNNEHTKTVIKAKLVIDDDVPDEIMTEVLESIFYFHIQTSEPVLIESIEKISFPIANPNDFYIVCINNEQDSFTFDILDDTGWKIGEIIRIRPVKQSNDELKKGCTHKFDRKKLHMCRKKSNLSDKKKSNKSSSLNSPKFDNTKTEQNYNGNCKRTASHSDVITVKIPPMNTAENIDAENLVSCNATASSDSSKKPDEIDEKLQTTSTIIRENSVDDEENRLIVKALKQYTTQVSDKNANFSQLGLDSFEMGLLEAKLRHDLQPRYNIPDGCIFKYNTILSLNQFLKKNKREAGFGSVNEMLSSMIQHNQEIPLSKPQQRFIAAAKLNPNDEAQYLESFHIKFFSAKLRQLRYAINREIARQNILRTTYTSKSQIVWSLTESFINLQLTATSYQLEKLDIFHKPPIAFFLQQTDSNDPGCCQLIITMHHIVIDAQSLSMFTEECQQLYAGILLEQPVHSYSEYTLAEQIKQAQDSQVDEKKAYWRNIFSHPNMQNLPANNTRSDYFSHKGRCMRITLSEASIQKLMNLRRKYNITMSSSIIGTFYILLNLLYGIDDYCIAVPVSQRNEKQWQTVIGCFINLLPVRIKINHNASINKFFVDIGRRISEAIANQLPFGDLIKMLETEDITTVSNLFQIMIVIDRVSKASNESKELIKKNDTGYVKYDQIWYFEFDGKIPKAISVEYNTELLIPNTVQIMIKKFLKLVFELDAHNVDRVNDLRLELTSEENDNYVKKQRNRCDFPINQTPLQLIQQQFKQKFKTSSVKWRGKTYSSTLIQQFSNRLADNFESQYIKTYGELPMSDTYVILLLRRTPQMIAAILSIWKCGFAAVPISTDWSIQMIASTIKQLKFPPIICSSNFEVLSKLCPLTFLCKENIHGNECTANDTASDIFITKRCRQTVNNLAYITFTSGSTGKPKGVCTNFIGLNNLIMCYTETLAINCSSTIYQVVNHAFDIAFADMLEAFMNAANLLLAAERIPKVCELDAVTHAYVMPAYLACFEDNKIGCLAQLSKLHFGGEAIPGSFLEKLIKSGVNAYQQYGLTEHTIYTTLHPMKFGDSHQNIGRPMRNMSIDCEQSYNRRYSVSGVGLSRGYFANKATPDNAFRQRSTTTPEDAILRELQRCFLTSDNLQVQTNGQIKFLGRFDRVVKIRGIAVNLSDVENYVAEHPYVQSCYAVYYSQNNNSTSVINACITLTESVPPGQNNDTIEKTIKAYLYKKIPHFMVPSKMYVFAKLPTTSNGKVDENQLKQFLLNETEKNSDSQVCTSKSTEDFELYKIFAETLNKGPLDLNASLFENGGDSLKALLIQEKLEETYSIQLDIVMLFRSHTIAETIDHIKQLKRTKHKVNDTQKHSDFLQQKLVSPIKNPIPLSFQQEGLWITEQLSESASDSNTIHMIVEIQQRLPNNQLRVLLNYIIQKHPSLRIRLKTDEVEAQQILLSGTESYIAPQYIRHKHYKRSVCVNQQFPLKIKLCSKKGKIFLTLSIHHLIMDGHSLEIIKEDFANTYSQLIRQQSLQNRYLNQSDVYAYFLFSIRQRKDESSLLEQSKKWIKMVKEVPALRIPYDYSKKKHLKKLANVITITLNLAMSSIQNFCKKYRCTTFTLLITAYSILMSHISGLKEFTVGMPVANRSLVTKNTVGLFTNTVLLKLNTMLEKTSDLIASIQESINYSLTAQKIPFELIVRCLNPTRRGTRTPCIYHSIVMHETPPISTITDNSLKLIFREIPQKVALYDQTWYFAPSRDNVTLRLIYCKELFSYERIQMSILLYQRILLHLVQEDNIFTTILQTRQMQCKNNNLSNVSQTFHMQIKQQTSKKRNNTEKSNGLNNVKTITSGINLQALAEKKRLEEEIKKVWEDVLRRPVSVEDNFFSIGGHSINAAKICFQISRALNFECSLAILFECQTIKKMVSKIMQDKRTNTAKCSIKKSTEFPSLVCDLQIPILSLYESKSDAAIAYNTGFTLQLDNVNVKRLRMCLNTIVMLHSALRSSFVTQNHKYQAVIHSGTECFIMLRSELEERSSTSGFSCNLLQPFEQIPIKSELKEYGKTWIFKLLLSHLMVDRDSLNIIQNNFLQFYSGEKPKITKAVPYYEFSKFYQNRICEFQSKCESYWENKLKDVAVENFSVAKNLPVKYSYQSAYMKKNFKSLNRIIGQITNHYNVTSFTVQLTAFAVVLLQRIVDGKQVVIATPLSMRAANAEETVGFFLNTLPMVIGFDAQDSDFDKLQKTFKLLQEAYDNSIVSTEFINKQCLNGQRIKAMITTENYDHSPNILDQWVILEDTDDSGFAKYELTFFVRSCQDDLELKVEYSKDLYNREIISELMDDWVKFISIMSSRPRIPIPDPYTTRTTDIPLSTISRIIRQNASRITNKKAIFNQNCTLNYGELWTSITSASQEIYQSLCTCLGEFPTNDMILPIVSRKSLKTIITCLAIINIGISYLPLDQNTPQKRLKTIFERTSTKCYIADKDLSISGSTALIVHFNLPSAAVTSEALRERSDLSSALYTIYTSGTTGEPKGVLIVQQSVVNLAVESTQNFFMKATDCVYQFTNFCFDNSVLEIIMALTNGSALLVKEDPFVPEHFINEIDQYQITHALLFPSLVEVFDDEELQQLKKLRYWIVGAEKLSENILNQSLANGTNVIQNYGPTETTAYALYKYMHILDHPNNLGRPIANVRAFVSDTRNLKNLTPNFAKNQLVLQGINLMRGYILSDSTNKCKLMNMYYCTGDLVYKQPDGNIIFIGRNDQQVKIRGFRIELTEIEAVLLKESSVKQAKVIVKNPEKHLHAFLVSRHPDDILKTNDIKNFCKQYLPYYMIPTCFQQIQTIPINSNSKVDFKKLEDYAKEYKDVQFTEQPQTDTEKTLLQIFHDDLGSPVSLVDDFFLIGGNSLLAQRVIEQIEIEFKVQIPLQAIYRYKTIKGLAELIDNTKQDELHCAVGQPHSTVDGTRYEPGQLLPISFEQQQIYYLNNTEFASYYNLIFSQKFPNTTNLKHLHHSFHRMILKQQSLRTVFKEVNFDAYQFLLSGTEAYFHLWIENDTDMIKISELSKQAFNYSNAPPIMCLLQATTDSFFVVMIVNHIISDAWSTRIIETEMKHFYTNKTEDETWKKKLDYSYVWYSKQQQNSSSLDEIRKKSEFFANYMCEHIADNRTLWSDYPKNELSTSNFQNYQSRIPKEQYQNLLKTCSNYSCSPSVLFLSALTATVHSITSNRTVIVGVVASNRNNQTKNIIGNFLNLLLVPSTFSSKEGHNQISDHLNRIKVSLETSQQYETVPILPLLRKIRYVTKKKFTPEIIFNCRYTIENNSTNEISVPNVQEFDKCMYAIEMDVDLVDGEYCWTIRIHNDTILVQHQTEFRETFSNLLQQLINLFKNEEAKEGKQAANNKLAENTSKNTAMEEVEKKLKTIWKNCLNTEFFTTTSDFFFVGGDSLSCLKLKRHINETFLTDIPIEQLTNNSIFNQMVHTIHYKIMENSCKNAIDQKIPSNVLIELNPRSTATTQSVIFLHPLIGGITLPYIHVVHELIKLDNNLQILGCQHPNTFSNHFNDPHYNSSIEKLCSMYVEKLLPHLNDSKCTLVGASLGGILCYECANQLNTKGITIDNLIAIDSTAGNLTTDEQQFPEHQKQTLDILKHFCNNDNYVDDITKQAIIDNSWKLLQMRASYCMKPNLNLNAYQLLLEDSNDAYSWSNYCRVSTIKIEGSHLTMLDRTHSHKIANIIYKIISRNKN